MSFFRILQRAAFTGSSLFMITMLLGLCACGRKQADDQLKLEFEKENLNWNMAALKMESEITKNLNAMEVKLMSQTDGLSESDAAAVRDSLKPAMRNWIVAAELVSDHFDTFLDENQQWLSRLKSEGMDEEVARAWWDNRRSRFQELMTESKSLGEGISAIL